MTRRFALAALVAISLAAPARAQFAPGSPDERSTPRPSPR